MSRHETFSAKLRQIFLAILCITVLLYPEASLSTTTGNEFVTLKKLDLHTILQEIILDKTTLSKDNIKISNFSSHPASISIPMGVIEHQVISKSNANHLGRVMAFVSILVDGYEQARVKLSADIQLFGDVVVTAKTLKRRKVISASDIDVRNQDITMLGPGYVDDPNLAVGKELTTTLRPGTVVYSRLLKNPILVKRGDVVSILAQTNSLKVSVPGRVQDAGAKGDTIRVKNLMSRREIYAKVINSNQVQVDF